MGWRNYATTQQPTSASFNTPSFPLASANNYAQILPRGCVCLSPHLSLQCRKPYPQDGRTDQAVMTRQELIKLQRTIGFSQSLLQYLGTFSREQTGRRPIGPSLMVIYAARFDMNNLALAIPDAWIVHPGNRSRSRLGLQKHTLFAQLFGLSG